MTPNTVIFYSRPIQDRRRFSSCVTLRLSNGTLKIAVPASVLRPIFSFLLCVILCNQFFLQFLVGSMYRLVYWCHCLFLYVVIFY